MARFRLPRKWWIYLLSLMGIVGVGGYVLRHDAGTSASSGASNTSQGLPPAPAPSLANNNANAPTEIGDDDVGHSNGDVHIRTIDGAFYDLQLVGEFVALKSDRGDLQIQLRTGPWQRTSKTVSTNIGAAMYVAGDRVCVYMRSANVLSINGTPVPSLDRPIQLSKGGLISMAGSRISVVWPDDTVANIDLRGDYLDLSVGPGRAQAGALSGLFGNFDGDAANDLVARGSPRAAAASVPKEGDETSTRAFHSRFADSWRLSQAESLFDYGPGETTATWTDLNFPYQIVSTAGLDSAVRQKAEEACRAAGVTDPRFLRNCALDIAVTGDQRFSQSAMQAQNETLLKEGFECRGLRTGGYRCTFYRPSLQNARAGGEFHISLETMDGDSKRVEQFDCAAIDAKHRAACKFNTKGRVFAGSNTVESYVAENGQAQELKETMQSR